MLTCKTWGIFVLLSLVISPTWALSSPDAAAHGWLEKMALAAHQLNYEGTFVYLHDRRVMSMRITHRVDAGGEHERLVALNGSGREVTRDNSTITSILPVNPNGDAKNRLRRALPEALAHEIWQLDAHYKFSLVGQERVAGRLTQMVLIKPRDHYRYGYRIWVDTSSGLLLRADMLDEKDMPVEQLMFTTVIFDSHSISQVGAPQVPTVRTVPDSEKDALPSTDFSGLSKDLQRDWRILRLPDGFQIVDYNTYPMPESGSLEHIVFSDGLSAVSLFFEKFDPQDKFIGTSHRGAVNAFGLVAHGYQITLVGEVPQAAVQLIGESIQYVGQP